METTQIYKDLVSNYDVGLTFALVFLVLSMAGNCILLYKLGKKGGW